MISNFGHLSNPALIHQLDVAVMKERSSTAEVVALIAQVEARGLYRGEGYCTIFDYCVGRLRMSEDSAFKRMRAARASRESPVILEMLADGRLHLTAVLKLSGHLTPANAGELLEACTYKTKAAVERLLAERFPEPDAPTVVRAIAPLAAATPMPGPLEAFKASAMGVADADPVTTLAPEPVAPAISIETSRTTVPLDRARVRPIAPEKYALQLTISSRAHALMRRAQELLRHRGVTSEAEVLERALESLVGNLEKAKFAATDRPGKPRGSSNPRCIPAHVKRAVHERDGGRCTFVSAQGHRCESHDVEFDHIQPVARGGESTVANLRLRCRAHNQYEAERTFGEGFMLGRREAAKAETRAGVGT